MAKFRPDMRQFNGNRSPVVIYSMHGQLYMRSKSSLTGKRVKTDPAFSQTMEYASLFARASKIASAVYSLISPNKKNRKLYNAITGQAMKMIKNSGRPEPEILNELIHEYKTARTEHSPQP